MTEDATAVEATGRAVEAAGRIIVIAGCLYEVAALTTRRVPTITAVVHDIGRRGPVGRLTVWCIGGFVAFHFMEKLSR